MRTLFLISLFFSGILVSCKNEPTHFQKKSPKIERSKKKFPLDKIVIDNKGKKNEIQLINRTFLGNETRNYYGEKVPKTWKLLWKTYLGQGKTQVKRGQDVIWAGAGWTGQPLYFLENQKPYLIQGAYDHHLKKIDATNGKIVWQYKFDDVIKGTGTIWLNHHTAAPELRAIVIQGSRQSKNYYKKTAPALKGISLLTGKAVWELNVERTKSYSRDVDASAIVVNDTAYIGLENGYFVTFIPDARTARTKDKLRQPKILKKVKLFTNEDAANHGGNLVIEASPVLFDNKIFICAGSGHVVGYDLMKKKVFWDFFIGSDLDGSPVVTQDSCLLIAVEKQYIKGNGGVLKLNPRKKPRESVEWFFPVKNRNFADWKGGVIGSPSVYKNLCAFTAIDGNLYVVDYQNVKQDSIMLFDKKRKAATPKFVFQYPIGPSISTPIFVDDHLIAAGYHGIFIFQKQNEHFQLVKKISGRFEATPFVYDRKMFIASRDGYLYCFGDE